MGELVLMGMMRNAYKILIRQTEENSLFSIYSENNSLQIYVCNVLLTYLLLGAESFLRN
jgi:hypothetical protein